MSGRMAWTDTGEFDFLPGRATDAVAAVLDRLDPIRAQEGKQDEDPALPPDDVVDDDLDEDGEFDDEAADGEDDELLDDEDDLDDELIDLDDEYDDTDEDDRPHPGHRHDDY